MIELEKVHLEILKYGFNNSGGINYIQMVEHLRKNKIWFDGVPHSEYNASVLNIVISSFQTLEGNRIDIDSARRGEPCYLKPESISYLINYDAYRQTKADSEEARKEALQAMKYARISLIVSSVLAAISIVLSIIQMFFNNCK